MYGILKLVILSVALTLIECSSMNNNTAVHFRGPFENSPGRPTNITGDFAYTCTKDSSIKELKSHISLIYNVYCSGLYELLFTFPFVVKFNKQQCDDYDHDDYPERKSRSSEEVKEVVFKDLFVMAVYLKGSIFLRFTGKLKDPICNGGEVTMETYLINDGCDACRSKKGVRKLEAIMATLKIKGGKCQSECSGGSKHYFYPGVIDGDYRITDDQDLQSVESRQKVK